MDAPQVRLKSLQAAMKIQLPQLSNLDRVNLHLQGIFKVDQAGVVCPMIRRSKRNAVANIIGTFGRTNR